MITCLHPKIIYNKYLGRKMAVPCGKCSACLCLHQNSWINRLELESSYHKYTLFVTLTYSGDNFPTLNINELDGNSDTWEQSLDESESFIKLNHGVIRTHSVRDIQNFFKKLRINLIREYGIPKEESGLRYFCAFEYGPTTFHPHYHLLLWFDSPRVARIIKVCIFEAWKSKTNHTQLSEFLRYNQCKFVSCSCARYVAGYIASNTNLPAVLREPPFRTKHLQSQKPPIGLPPVNEDNVRKYVSGQLTTISFTKPTTNKVVNVSLWQSFEGRYVPKCIRFASLSPSGRRCLYTFASFYGQGISFKEFIQRFLCDWLTVDSPAFHLFKEVFSYEEVDEVTGQKFLNTDSVKRAYYLSKRVYKLRRKLGLSIQDYVAGVERYYQRKEYIALTRQLQFEEEVSNRANLENSSISFLPCIIDPNFYTNERNLSPLVYQNYLEQFGICDDLLHYFPFFFADWQAKRLAYDSILRNSYKTRVKKDFVANHPEYANMYFDIYKLRFNYV